MRRTCLLLAAVALTACSDNNADPDARIPDLYGEWLGFPDGRVPEAGVPGDSDVQGDTAVNPLDWDGDGVENSVEQQLGLDPHNRDTDNDGTDDGQEVGDPNNPADGDGDGKIDAKEPDNFDSDLDGTVDNQDSDDTDGPCGQVQRLFLFATLGQDTTLTKDCSPYKVLGSLTVNGDATLTVAADVTVRFGPNAALYLGDNVTKAGLDLAGTKESISGVVHPVTLTADTQQPAKGYWRGVVAVNGKLVVLSHATVEYAGGPTGGSAPRALVLVQAADAITVNDSTLQHGTGHGLHATLSSSLGKLFLGFRGNVFSDVDHAAALNIRHVGEIETPNDFGTPGSGGEIQVSQGTLDENAQWKAVGVPYVFLEQSININADLQLEAGVKLVLPANAAVYVAYNNDGKGRIVAQGSSASPVILTSEPTTAGTWQGLLLGDGISSLQHVRIIGAGKTSSQNVSAGLYADQSAALAVKDLVVTNSSGYGAYLYRPGDGCTKVPTIEYSFGGTISGCGLFCLDDYNSPGQCLKQVP